MFGTVVIGPRSCTLWAGSLGLEPPGASHDQHGEHNADDGQAGQHPGPVRTEPLARAAGPRIRRGSGGPRHRSARRRAPQLPRHRPGPARSRPRSSRHVPRPPQDTLAPTPGNPQCPASLRRVRPALSPLALARQPDAPDLLARPLPRPLRRDERVARCAPPPAGRSSTRSRTSNPCDRNSRIQSPWLRWNSATPSDHSTRCMPNWGRIMRSSAAVVVVVGRAEHQEGAVAEEDELSSGSQHARRLGHPPVGVGPDGGAVLADGEVEGPVGEGQSLGRRADQREAQPELLLHARRRSATGSPWGRPRRDARRAGPARTRRRPCHSRARRRAGRPRRAAGGGPRTRGHGRRPSGARWPSCAGRPGTGPPPVGSNGPC